MRVLLLINAFEHDAPSRMMAQVAIGARAAGHEAMVTALMRPGPLEDDLRQGGIPTALLKMTGRAVWQSTSQLNKVLADFRPDIFHTTLVRPTLVGVPVARKCGIDRIVITQNGVHEWQECGALVNPFVPGLFRAAAVRARAVVAVSNATRADLESAGIEPAKLQTIHNGIETEKFPVRAGDDSLAKSRRQLRRVLFGEETPNSLIVVGAAGNLRLVKGHRTLVQAAALAHKKRSELRFVVWGEGPERRALESKLQQEELGNVFHLPGATANIPAALAACDLFVQPSQQEAFGLAAVEAMCCGLPVVASRVGGLQEIVEDTVTGLLVSPDSPTELAKAVLDLAGDESRRTAMGERGRQRVMHKFTAGGMVDEYVKLYATLMDGE